MQHGLDIERWAFWSPESHTPEGWRAHWMQAGAGPADSPVPDDAIPAAHRRRMSPLSKLAVQVALEASRDAAPDFLVFASQHGELARTRELLANIVAGEELSPASFSQSVHNTSAGLYTIVGRSHAPASSVAAGASSFAYGWLEAEGYLAANREHRALLVAYDDVLPLEYRAYTNRTQCAYGVAFLLRLGTRGAGITLEPADPANDDQPLPLAPLFAAWYLSAQSNLRVAVDGQAWLWQRA